MPPTPFLYLCSPKQQTHAPGSSVLMLFCYWLTSFIKICSLERMPNFSPGQTLQAHGFICLRELLWIAKRSVSWEAWLHGVRSQIQVGRV